MGTVSVTAGETSPCSLAGKKGSDTTLVASQLK